MNNFAINFKRLRESMNYTQDYVAYQLCVPPQAIESWERGEAMPDSNVLPQIANMFCCSIDLLFQDPSTDTSESTAFTLFGKGALTRRKVRDVMFLTAVRGIVVGSIAIVFGVIVSIVLLLSEHGKAVSAITLILALAGLISVIYFGKRLHDIKHDNLDSSSKERKKTESD